MTVYLAIFAPDLATFSTRLLGYEYVDAYGTQWFYWFVGRALHGLQGFAHTDLFFYPFGKDIYQHTGANVLDAIVAQPFLAIFGQTSGYNVFCLFALLINGAAAWRLMGLFATDPVARFLGAAFYALNPFLLSELLEGRATQVFQPFLPLFFYHLLRFEDHGWKDAVWASVFLALTALTYWFYAIFAGMIAVVHFLQRVALHPEPRRFFVRHALAGALALTMVIPAALPLIHATLQGDTPGLLSEPTWPFTHLASTTGEGVSVGLYLFQPLMRANGFVVANSDGSETFFPNAIVLTWTQMALAALGLGLSRHRLVLGAMLGGALILSVGHELWAFGTAIPNPLYILAVWVIPFMRRLWWPGRAMVLVSLLLGVLAAAGLGEVARRKGGTLALVLGLVAMATFGAELKADGYIPFPTWSASIPTGYACLAQGPPGALIELPYGKSQAHLYYQTLHGRPILGGMVEDNPIFTPAEQRDLIKTNSFLHLIMTLGDDARAAGSYDEKDRAAVHDLGYSYVVVEHAGYVRGEPKSHLIDVNKSEQASALHRRLTAMLGAPVYTDPDITIYSPWGEPSPCGSAGPGRLSGDMQRPEKRPSTGESVTIRPALTSVDQ